MTEETATSTRRPKPKVSTTAMVGRQQRQAGRAAAGGFAASPPTGALVMISCVMADLPWLPDLRLFGDDLDPLAGLQRRLGEAVEHQEALQVRSEEHTSELQSLMRISYAVFCLKKKK